MTTNPALKNKLSLSMLSVKRPPPLTFEALRPHLSDAIINHVLRTVFDGTLSVSISFWSPRQVTALQAALSGEGWRTRCSSRSVFRNFRGCSKAR